MVDREVRKTRRIVRHAIPPRPAETAPTPSSPAPAPTPVPVADVRDGDGAGGPAEDVVPAEEKPSLGTMVVPERPIGFPTAATLADQDAAAAELRQDLDRLRRLLDERPPPLPVRTRKRNRRPLLGVLVVGGTLGAIATATLVPWSSLGLPGHRTDGANRTTTSAQPSSAAVPARPVAAVPLALSPRSAPVGSLPASGPGISAPGTMMVVQIGAGGDLIVVEYAVLGPRGLRELNLTLPSMTSLGGAVASLNPSVRNLRVAVNGVPVNVAPSADGSGWTVLATAERARTVQLSYRLTQAVVRSKPSNTGRALAVSLPLLGQALREQGLPLVVRAIGPQVGGVTCPGAPAAGILCGMQAKDGWTATVPATATSPLLLLQLNLTS